MDLSSPSFGTVPSGCSRCCCPRASSLPVHSSNGYLSNFVDSNTSCLRAQSPTSISFSGAHSDNLIAQRVGHNCHMPDVPVTSSSLYSSFPLVGTSSSASNRISSSEMPLTYRDSWNSLAGAPARGSDRTPSSAFLPDHVGHITTNLPVNHIDPQMSPTHPRTQRKSSNRDEFDGPHQLLSLPSPRTIAAKDQPFPVLPVSFSAGEQDDIFGRLNEVLCKCAYDFIARYQFPIPVEPDRRLVITPQDREWKEWVYLLKRLATKRRIPARVLYENQIKHLVTVLENSVEPTYANTHQERPLKDDRSILQFISAGTQVAKMLKDAAAMGHLDRLYVQTASCIQDRRWTGLPI